MKYVVLVSHGEFADGLKNAVFMLSGQKEEVISTGLMNGLSADEFALVFEDRIKEITHDDEIIVLADLIGGSPLTTAMNVFSSKGLLDKAIVIGGMNLPLALTTVVMKDNMELDQLVSVVLPEGQNALKQFELATEEEDDI